MRKENWKREEQKIRAGWQNYAQLLHKSPEWIEQEVQREIRGLAAQWHREVYEDSIRVFLEEEEGFCYDLSACISSQELYAIYSAWCHKEKVVPEGLRALCWRLKHSEERYPVRETTLTRNGRRCRGFRGIRAVTENTDKG